MFLFIFLQQSLKYKISIDRLDFFKHCENVKITKNMCWQNRFNANDNHWQYWYYRWVLEIWFWLNIRPDLLQQKVENELFLQAEFYWREEIVISLRTKPRVKYFRESITQFLVCTILFFSIADLTKILGKHAKNNYSFFCIFCIKIILNKNFYYIQYFMYNFDINNNYKKLY